MKTLVQELLIKLSRAGLNTNVLTGISALLAVTLVGCSSDDSSDDGQTKEQVKAQITSALDSYGDGKSDYATTAQLADLNTAVDKVGDGHMTTDKVAAQVTAALADANLSADALQALADTANDAADDAWAASEDAWEAAYGDDGAWDAVEAADSHATAAAASADAAATAAAISAADGDGSAADETYADTVLAEAQAAQTAAETAQAAAETAQAAAETAQAVAEAAQAAAEAAAAASATTPAAPAATGFVFKHDEMDNLKGTSSDDIFLAGSGTYTAGDNADGNGGNDALRWYVAASDNNRDMITDAIQSVEIYYSNTAATVNDLDTGNDVTELSLNDISADVTLNMSSVVANVTINNWTSNNVTLIPDNLAATDDAVTVALDKVTAAILNLDGIETVNLVSQDTDSVVAANSLRIDNDGTGTTETTINVSGAEKLLLHATDAKFVNNTGDGMLEIVNASTGDFEKVTTINGALKVDATNDSTATTYESTGTGPMEVTAVPAVKTTFNGGDGDDVIHFAAAANLHYTSATDKDTLDGGDGHDILKQVGDGTANTNLDVKNFEEAYFVSDSTDLFDFDGFATPAQFTHVTVESTANADDFTAQDTQAHTMKLMNAKTAATAESFDELTYDKKDSTALDDVMTLALHNRQEGTAGNQNDMVLDGFTATGIEKVNVVTSKESSEGTAEDITVTTFTADAMKTLDVSGNADFKITNVLAATVTTIDASVATGLVDIDVAGNSSFTYSGGDGKDVLTVTGDYASVSGGAGGDDVLELTFAAGLTTFGQTEWESLKGNFTGGSLDMDNGTTDLVIKTHTATTAITNVVGEVKQETGGGSNLSLQADASLVYSNGGAGAVTVQTGATTFNTGGDLEIKVDNGATTDSLLTLGATTLQNVENLTFTGNDDVGDDLTVGAITADADLKTIAITSTGSKMDLAAITATTADITSINVNLTGAYETSDIAIISAKSVGTVNISAGKEGTGFNLTQITSAGNIGDVTISAKVADGGTNLFASSGGTKSLGNLTLESIEGALTLADGGGEFLVDGVTSMGNLTAHATVAAGSLTLGTTSSDVLTVGDIDMSVNKGSITSAGFASATTVGSANINADLGETVTFTNYAAAGATIGAITITGAGAVSLAEGDAVNSFGVIDATAATATSTVTVNFSAVVNGMTMNGGLGSDVFTGGAGGDMINGGSGNDTLAGGAGTDNINGGDGNDTLNGDAGADILNGDGGVDILNGGGGTDTLKGGAGNDALTGGTGIDDFHFKINDDSNGSDTIADFGDGADQFQFAVAGGGSFANVHGYTLATTTALAAHGTPIAIADQKVYIVEVATLATIDTAAEVVTAIADAGVMDAVDWAVNVDAYLVIGAEDDLTKAYVYGVDNNNNTTIAAGELDLVATVDLDASMTGGVNDLTAANFEFM
jgi:hypothetical protein